MRAAAILALVGGLAAPAGGALGAPWLCEGFDDFAGLGFAPSPAPGQLDSDLWRVTGLSAGEGRFGGTHAGGDFARGASAGGVGTGGVYAFDVSNGGPGDPALGLQGTGSDLTPGTVELRLANPLPVAIDRLDLGFDLLVRNDGPRSSLVEVSVDTGAGALALPGLGLATARAADPAAGWTRATRSLSLDGLGLAPGQLLTLVWRVDDRAGSGARDEIAIDNVRLGPAVTASVGEPGTALLLAIPLAGLLRRRARSRVRRPGPRRIPVPP